MARINRANATSSTTDLATELIAEAKKFAPKYLVGGERGIRTLAFQGLHYERKGQKTAWSRREPPNSATDSATL
jgi:hypothetical protein